MHISQPTRGVSLNRYLSRYRSGRKVGGFSDPTPAMTGSQRRALTESSGRDFYACQLVNSVKLEKKGLRERGWGSFPSWPHSVVKRTWTCPACVSVGCGSLSICKWGVKRGRCATEPPIGLLPRRPKSTDGWITENSNISGKKTLTDSPYIININFNYL